MSCYVLTEWSKCCFCGAQKEFRIDVLRQFYFVLLDILPGLAGALVLISWRSRCLYTRLRNKTNSPGYWRVACLSECFMLAVDFFTLLPLLIVAVS